MLTRKDYNMGKRFLVTRAGATITGLDPHQLPGAYRPVSIDLPVGTILTCGGERPGWGGDGGTEIRWFDADGNEFYGYAGFRPEVGNMWFSVPDPAYLEPLSEGDVI